MNYFIRLLHNYIVISLDYYIIIELVGAVGAFVTIAVEGFQFTINCIELYHYVEYQNIITDTFVILLNCSLTLKLFYDKCYFLICVHTFHWTTNFIIFTQLNIFPMHTALMSALCGYSW